MPAAYVKPYVSVILAPRAGRDEGTVLGARVLTGQRSSDLDKRQGKCRRAALTQCHCLENPAFAPLVVLHITE